MKYSILAALLLTGSLSNANGQNTYLISDDKVYKLVEIDGELLVSNEWTPLYESGYTEEYIQKVKDETVRHANDFLKNNRKID